MEPCPRLVLPSITEPRTGNTLPKPRADPLWLAVQLPWLAGEVTDGGPGQIMVVSGESPRGQVVYRASPAARQQGIGPGMTLSAANVLCPGLGIQPRQPEREAHRLNEIGTQMQSFSPVVSLEAPETVLIEVRGSLNLFGGVDRLRALIGRQLEAAGHVYRIAGAPTPSAAGCLARWGRDIVVTEKSDLRSALGDMPVVLLPLDPKTTRRLARAGIRRLRDLWRLPADGLGRRFGAALVRELSRLRGSHPDPLQRHEPGPHFSTRLMLDWATDDLAQIIQGIDCLLQQWVDYLRRSARATSGFSIECRPEGRGVVTRLEVGMRHASRDRDHLRRLAAEKLSRVRLPGPVAELALHSDRIHFLAGRNRELFETEEAAGLQWRQTEELLSARLEGEGLEIPDTVAEHRPEHAWRLTRSARFVDGHAAPGLRRPLWLLQPPRPLSWKRPPRNREGNGIIAGPERIETGWWDRRDQRRDYYIATDRRGRRLWVFRDLKRSQWYLHGLFA